LWFSANIAPFDQQQTNLA